MAWSEQLFYIAFVSQIYLMSWYLPNLVLARMQRVLACYPPETYPKLYPRPVEHYKMAHLAFRYVSRFVLLVGTLVLLAMMFWVDHSTFADHGFISNAWPAAYGILQFLPLMAIEFSELSHFRQMRKANASTKRVADLRRRGFTDLVSPLLIGAAALMFLGAVLFDLYAHDFAVSWGHDTVQRAIVTAVTNGLLIIVGAWSVYRRKPDPHQSPADWNHRLSIALKSLLFVSMALSLFIAFTAADDIYNMDAVDALMMSVYFQAVALLSLGFTLHNIKLEDVDFDVYKNDAAAA